MKIEAKFYNRNITIIAIVPYGSLLRVVYVDEHGNINYTYHDSINLEVIDTSYLPWKEVR